MITYESNKVIKVYSDAGGIHLLITIIQFYNNDSSMSIKIYEMFNNNGFRYLCQPHIQILKNSFLIGLAASKNNRHRPGYFFVNFPNSKDMTLTTTNIIIKDIISLENRLFNINIKFLILDMPTDFIFVNKLNSEIKTNYVELDMDDELILRQYRIKGNTKILKFQAIAKGNDLGYVHLIKYPTGTTSQNNVISIEGRIGEIKINFQDCLNGYYHLYNDPNLCTNVKPIGHYLDEDIKTFVACKPSCGECNKPINDTYMNCITCKTNYYMTEDTKSCYDNEIYNYFFR